MHAMEKGQVVKRAYIGARITGNNSGSVAAVGEIADEYLHRQSENTEVLHDTHKKALKKAQGINVSSISKQSDEEKTPNIDKKPPTMVELKLDVSNPLDNLSFISNEKESESKEGPNLGYFPRTLCDGCIHAFTRDCGDSIEILFYKGVIINKPGIVVAAVGGIPDELKIKDGLSFSYPCPSLKICKYLTYDSSKLHKLHFDPFDGVMEKKAFVETLQQAYNKARGISSSSSKVQKKKEYDKDQPSLSLAMMEVNVDPSIDHIFQWSRKDVLHGYSLHYSVDDTVKMIRRDCGDHLEIFVYKGVLINVPGFCVVAAGGIPDELKIDGGQRLLYPCPAVKVRKDLLMDPAQRQKAVNDAYCEAWGSHACEEAILQAREKQLLSCGTISVQSENMDQQPLAMIEVNLAVTPSMGTRTGSSSHELKDSNMEK